MLKKALKKQTKCLYSSWQGVSGLKLNETGMHVSDDTFFRLIIDQNRHGFEARRLQEDAATWFQEMDLARCRFIVSFQHVLVTN